MGGTPGGALKVASCPQHLFCLAAAGSILYNKELILSEVFPQFCKPIQQILRQKTDVTETPFVAHCKYR